MAGPEQVVELELDSADGERLAWLYRHGTVLERRDGDGRTHLKVALPAAEQARLWHDLRGAEAFSATPENPSGGR